MARSVGKYLIETETSGRKGKVWNVRVYKKGLLKRLVSSDWFLDEEQAHAFVRHLEEKLSNDAAVSVLTKRKPGWNFTNPQRNAG